MNTPNRHPSVVGLQLVESTALPGGGLLLGWATARSPWDVIGERAVRVVLDHFGVADENTLDRWPDLAPEAEQEWWHRREGDDALAAELNEELNRIKEAGDVLAVWDSPVTFERLRRYGITPPENILDLKVMHTIRFKNWDGRRNLVGMARALRVDDVDTSKNRARGMESEAKLAHSVGKRLMNEMAAQGIHFPGVRYLQERSAYRMEKELAERWQQHNRPMRALRTGWPRWDSLGYTGE